MNREKLFAFFKQNKILLIAGILSLVCLLLIRDSAGTATAVTAMPEPYATYATDLERELEAMLSKMAGVGTCQVMITLRGTSETVYATETVSDRESLSDAQKTEESERRDSTFRTVRNGNDESPIRIAEYAPEICGVAVLCDGGGSDALRLQVRNLLATVLGIPGNCIYVAEKQK